jgi:broad specificity phosphatase PhoE
MLYIMRHGKTDWNAKHKLQGRTDIPLNEEGIQMAEQAKEKYKDVNFDICYCSPLVRAKQTAEIVLEGRNIPIVYDDRLMEMCFGVYEGVTHPSQIEGSLIRKLFKDPANYPGVEDGETFDDLFARTGSFLKEVVQPQLDAGKDVIIVGHGAMDSSIVCQVQNIPLEKFWDAGIENCKLMKLL